MKDIEKAIRDADLGVNPTDDGQVLRINLPALTEERRKEYVVFSHARRLKIRRFRAFRASALRIRIRSRRTAKPVRTKWIVLKRNLKC